MLCRLDTHLARSYSIFLKFAQWFWLNKLAETFNSRQQVLRWKILNNFRGIISNIKGKSRLYLNCFATCNSLLTRGKGKVWKDENSTRDFSSNKVSNSFKMQKALITAYILVKILEVFYFSKRFSNHFQPASLEKFPVFSHDFTTL